MGPSLSARCTVARVSAALRLHKDPVSRSALCLKGLWTSATPVPVRNRALWATTLNGGWCALRDHFKVGKQRYGRNILLCRPRWCWWSIEPGAHIQVPCILLSAHFLRSLTVRTLRKGLALTSFSRVVRPVRSAEAIRVAASAFSAPDSSATAPAGPAK